MQSLDAHTLAVVSALAAFFMAVTMAGIYLAGNREAAIADWALAGLMLCLGHVLAVFTLGTSGFEDRTLALALTNASVALGYGMVVLGIQQHLEQPRWTAAIFLLAIGIGLSIAFVPIMHESTVLRVSVLTAAYAGFSIVGTVLLWRADDRRLKPYRRAVGVVLMANTLVLIIRALYVVYGEHGTSDPAASIVLVPVLLSAVLFYMALNVALALMLFRRKEVHLRFLARHDALTGLLNRYSLDEYAAREIARSARGENELSLVVLDLDNFKQVNDQHGHAAGDQVLVQAARRLHEVIREGDIAFRVGGEEFLVLLPGAGHEVAPRVAERLRMALVDRPFECLDRSMTVSTSVGVVTFDPLRDDWESLLRRADQALYRAKGMGRNRVEVAGGLPSADGAA